MGKENLCDLEHWIYIDINASGGNVLQIDSLTHIPKCENAAACLIPGAAHLVLTCRKNSHETVFCLFVSTNEVGEE